MGVVPGYKTKSCQIHFVPLVIFQPLKKILVSIFGQSIIEEELYSEIVV